MVTCGSCWDSWESDPSIKVRRDPETGQTIVETQGELHMEVVKDRLVRGYGLDVFVGPLQVAYKEVLSRGGEHSAAVEEKMGEKGRVQSAAVRLRVEPLPINDKFQKVELDLEPGAPPVRHEWQRAINEGCRNALHNGPLGGFPVHGIRVQLLQLTVSGGKINPALLSACTHKCMTEALQKGETRLVEPIVQIQISVGNGENTQPLLQELAKRRTQISNCEKIDEETSVVEGKLPLAETENLARVVRTLTSGFGFLHVQVCGYQVVSEGEEATILRNLRGQ